MITGNINWNKILSASQYSYLLLGAVGLLLIWITAKQHKFKFVGYLLCAIGFGSYFAYAAGFSTYVFFSGITSLNGYRYGGSSVGSNIISLLLTAAQTVFLTIFTVHITRFFVAHCKLSKNVPLGEKTLSTFTPVCLIIIASILFMQSIMTMVSGSMYYSVSYYLRSISFSLIINIFTIGVDIVAAIALFMYRSKIESRRI